jgi:hypothetical protein
MASSVSSGATIASFDVGSINCAMFVVDAVGAVLLFHVEPVGDDCVSVVDALDRWLCVWRECNAFLVENQLPVNRRACRIQACIMTYFQTLFGSFKTTIAVSSRLKTFGAKCLDKRQRKLYCVEFAKNLIADQWPHLLESLTAMKKKDDIADAVCQWLAFCKTNGALVD